MAIYIEPRLNDVAHEYFGDDVQRYWIVRERSPVSYATYRLYQQPHRGDRREFANVVAKTAAEARLLFERMAADATWKPSEEDAA